MAEGATIAANVARPRLDRQLTQGELAATPPSFRSGANGKPTSSPASS